MWPTGSLPDRLGAPPVSLTSVASLLAPIPSTGTLPRTWRRMAVLPRESIQMTAGQSGSPDLVGRDGARPLGRACDRDDPLGRDPALGHDPTRRAR